ncbi:MAG: ABC transporter ATP-binding protein [Chromatiaceae bacterium]|jgi:putative ABC transport system ATP-binding protein|nr:ABC transporter ATP-binding protein [Chromatiaceae bacterium]
MAVSDASSQRRGKPVLAVRGLAKSYHDGRTEHAVLQDLELDVARGECLALLGRSGSGKSTLLNLLAGIDRPDRGEVRILGEPVSHLNEPALTLFRRRHIGFIYQFFNLVPTLRVAENLALPLELNGVDDVRARARVSELLTRVDLADRATAFPDQLSGGEQQRVAIARALVHQPAIVLADEPTGNLDAATGEQILELLTELFREQGQTLILVTHSLAVSRIANRVLSIDGGRITEDAAQLSW